ncbi:MAG: amino acid-binding protein [Myxococcota bacterium]|jgi:hypothetical protein|nr:amino acid-binding protein [Myxococcota bacterium]
MDLIVQHEDVWAATIDDSPGALAGKLTALAEAGADLDSVIARRSPETPGQGVVFVTPVRGDREVEAAGLLGFVASGSLHGLRVEGKNERGRAARVTEVLARAGINLRGFSGSVIGTQFVLHLAFDRDEDARQAAALLTTSG